MSVLIAPTQINTVAPKPQLTKQQTKALTSSLGREQLIETVADLLEDILTERCTRYTSLEEIPEKTPFHAKKIPGICLKDYMKRFATFSNCNDNVFVLTLIFFDKLGQDVPDFCLDSFNIHR